MYYLFARTGKRFQDGWLQIIIALVIKPQRYFKAFWSTLFIATLPFSMYSLIWFYDLRTVYPKKYAHGFCFAVLCCGYTLTGFPISIRLTSLALWQSNDCPSASKATLMNMDIYFMWIHYERLHNHNKAKHNKTVCIFLGIYCLYSGRISIDFPGFWSWLVP